MSLLASAARMVVEGSLPRKASRTAADVDMSAEWQRVNSYVADTLKDSHVLYAKLARLQSDFAGEELDRLLQISEAVLTLGEELSGFAKDFYNGRLQMVDSDFAYSGQEKPPQDEMFQPFGEPPVPPVEGGEVPVPEEGGAEEEQGGGQQTEERE